MDLLRTYKLIERACRLRPCAMALPHVLIEEEHLVIQIVCRFPLLRACICL